MTPAELPLHDIVDNYSTSWWPLAWGWWLIVLVVAGALTAAAFLLYKRHQKQRPKRLALAALQQPAHSISDLNLRLKQAALLYYPRDQVANLHGDSWFTFLTNSLPEQRRAEFKQAFIEYSYVQYQPHEHSTVESYKILLQRWVGLAWPPQHKRSGNV